MWKGANVVEVLVMLAYWGLKCPTKCNAAGWVKEDIILFIHPCFLYFSFLPSDSGIFFLFYFMNITAPFSPHRSHIILFAFIHPSLPLLVFFFFFFITSIWPLPALQPSHSPPNPVYCSRASAVIKMEHALGARHATLPVLQHWYSDTDRHQTVNNRQGLRAEGGWRSRGKLTYSSS